MDLLTNASRFTFDGNTAQRGDRGYDPRLVLHAELRRPGQWWITDNAMVYNHRTGEWDDEYGARHAEGDERKAYFTGRDEAVEKAQDLLKG